MRCARQQAAGGGKIRFEVVTLPLRDRACQGRGRRIQVREQRDRLGVLAQQLGDEIGYSTRGGMYCSGRGDAGSGWFHAHRPVLWCRTWHNPALEAVGQALERMHTPTPHLVREL
jgi:hypothetical protein